MNKLFLLIVTFSCVLVGCEEEEKQSRQLGKQASEQVKQIERKIDKVAQDNIQQYEKIEELTQ